MSITKPTLPPRAGYVEVEIDGVRTYRNIQTGELIDEENALPEPQADTDAMLVDLEYRLTLLELGVN